MVCHKFDCMNPSPVLLPTILAVRAILKVAGESARAHSEQQMEAARLQAIQAQLAEVAAKAELGGFCATVAQQFSSPPVAN